MTLLIVYFCLTIGISMICSVCEAMMFSATPAFVESATKLTKTGKILKHLKTNIDNSIGAIVIVNTIANTVGAASVGAQFVVVFGEAWQGVVAGIMTLSVLYVGEIVPKTLGAMYWKRLILPACYPLIVLYYVAYPFVYISRIMTFFFRKNETQKMSRDEILALMELAEQSGSLDELEMDILERIMQQRGLKARDIMTDKNQMFALNENERIDSALQKLQANPYSRIPLIKGDLGDSSNSSDLGDLGNSNDLPKIDSLVYRQSVLASNLTNKGESALKSIAKNMRLVSENMQVMALLKLFVICREHLVGVVDKNKQFVGIVSLEDAINAVLGVGNLQRH